MKLKGYSALILLSLLFSDGDTINAQSWLWAKGIGGNSLDHVNSIIVDPTNGDVYSTGSFIGTVDFDPGPGTYFLTSVEYPWYSLFISKLDSSGNFVWAKAMIGTQMYSYDLSWGSSISLDTVSGSIFITGSFLGTVDFDPGPGIFNLTSTYPYYPEDCKCCPPVEELLENAYVVKLDSSGDFEWAVALGFDWGAYSGVYGTSITFDHSADGNVFITGIAYWTPPCYIRQNFIFISKIDSTGNFQWTKLMGGWGDDFGNSISVNTLRSGSVYTTGFFDGTVDFDPGAGTYNITATGESDIFVSKLDYSGNFLWAKAIGGIDTESGQSLIADSIGAVYVTGYFNGTVDFDPGPETYFLTSTGIYGNIFITKLDSMGSFVWAKVMIGTGGPNEYSFSSFISLDPAGSGGVYTTGDFTGTIDFDPGAGLFELTSDGYGDIFVSKLDSSGNFVGAIAVPGSSAYSKSLALNYSGNVYVAGYFHSSTITFGSTTLTNEGESDIYIAKLDGIYPCTGIVTNINDSGSGSLRDIIYCSSFGSTITFDNTLTDQTIQLTSGEIIINKNLNLSGLGILDLTISGNNASRIFHVLPGKNLDIENMSLKNATAVNNGGAIFSEGDLILENVLLQNNFENGIPKGLSIIPGGLITIGGNVDIKN